jgi:hypothetical protein
MKLFSQRQGLKPVRCSLQINDIDGELRNKLWNVFQIHYWNDLHSDDMRAQSNYPTRLYLERLWYDYFKDLLDTLPTTLRMAYLTLKKHYFASTWNEVYDFIEFTALRHPEEEINDQFKSGCNIVLEDELSGYRFVGDEIAPITSNEEIASIEQAQGTTSQLPSVNTHLRRSLSLLSDRKQPDYRNSIKESISAIEAICRLIAQNPKSTLGDALKALAPKIPVHPALAGAFDKLYGYTNDAQGIRHALLDLPNLEQEDAVFMLTSCSAFINYLTAKCARFGIKL